MLLTRYSNIEFILNTPFEIGFNHIKKAWDQERDKKIWQMWLTLYPNMSQDNFISYEDFKDSLLKEPERKVQSDADMLIMARILNAAHGGKVVEI